MEALAAIGLASNVLGFIDTTAKLHALIKEYSSMGGAPAEVLAISKRLDLTIRAVKELDESGRARLDHEKFAFQIYSEEAEGLRVFLESLKLTPDQPRERGSNSSWPKRMQATARTAEKGWKAFKALRGKEKLDKFQKSLDRILDLIKMQQQTRIEATALRVDDKTTILVQNSESIIRGLGNLQLSQNQPSRDASAMQRKIIFMVPLARNSGFVGRDELIVQLDKRLGSSPGSGPREVQTTALCGLGGIGKSQIALEYAYFRKERSPNTSTFWILASTATRFEESYKQIATEFQLPGRNDPHVDVLQLVRDWFERHYKQHWLMVIDNVDDTQIFEKMQYGKSPLEYLPKVADGSILFTSRNRDVCIDLGSDPITVEPLSPEEARKLLGDRTKRTSTDEEKDMVIAELDHLPLAISQAASYMAKRNKTVSQYLVLYQESEKSRVKLLEHKFVDTGREAKSLESVATTWLMSFQQIKSENPRAANLLFMMSLMGRQSIPSSLILAENENMVDFEEAVGTLVAYSFVSVDDSGINYSMHQLVQTVTRAWLDDHGDRLLIESQALGFLSSRFPDGEFETWETCAQYLPHVESVLSHTPESQAIAQRLHHSELLTNVAWYFKEQGKYDLARANMEQSLKILNTAGTGESGKALKAKRKFAIIVERQGHPEEAIKLFREVLKAEETLHGPDHLDTLETVDELAKTLSNTLFPERLVESEGLARRSLKGRRSALTEGDLKLMESLHTLGWVLYRAGKSNESEDSLRECLQKRKMILGDQHPTVGTLSQIGLQWLFDPLLQTLRCDPGKSLGLTNLQTTSTANDLALALINLNPPNYEEAERLFRESANLIISSCGTDHPNSIVIHSNLCNVLRRSEKHAEAETLLADQLTLSEKVLGQNHPTTIWCVVSVAESLFYQKKFYMTQSFILKELEKRPDLVRQDVVSALILINLLAHVCEENGEFTEAAKNFHSVLQGRKKVLGDDHPATLQTEHCFARVRLAQRMCSEAVGILRELMPREIRVLGLEHEETVLSVRLYGLAMFSQRKFPEAESQFRKVLNIREKTVGREHKTTLIARDNLEAALGEQRKWAEWEKVARESLAIRQLLAPSDYHTLRVKSNLWFVLEQQCKAESEAIFHELLANIRALPEDFMDGPNFKKNVTPEEEWYFWRLRNGSFDLETLRARTRMAAWSRNPRFTRGGAVASLESFFEASSQVSSDDLAGDIYHEVLRNMEHTFGKECEETKSVNEEYAKHLEQRGKVYEAKRVRERLQEFGI